jgi:hypothetical protein
MNPKGAESLLGSKVKLGTDASAAAGPKGRTAEAATDVVMKAEILSYSRNKGLFAGVSLEGSTLRSDGGANENLYGRKLSAKEIIREGKVKVPACAQELTALLNKKTPKNRSDPKSLGSKANLNDIPALSNRIRRVTRSGRSSATMDAIQPPIDTPPRATGPKWLASRNEITNFASPQGSNRCGRQVSRIVHSHTETVGRTATTLEKFCRAYSERFGWRSVWVTREVNGCSIVQDGKFVEVGGFPVVSPHPVGAGDAFTAAVRHGISQGWPPERTGEFANRVGAVVASRPGAVSDWTIEDCYALTRE